MQGMYEGYLSSAWGLLCFSLVFQSAVFLERRRIMHQ
uniref:Heme exporter protein D n=1 Tax=Anguilla anguilla TaxID=7936 RepID=A0A0E9PJB7_ANGAN